MRRNICFLTGTRAEYGLLRPLIKAVAANPLLDYTIICTGMHLAAEFGLTYQEIESDGFSIDKKVEMLLSSDTSIGVAKSMAIGLIGFSEALNEIKPDILVLLGDRSETLAAATAACVATLPIAHIHGGEVTQGAIDDAFRHAITKMSSIHFTSTEIYRKRVIQLGENPDTVYNVGALGVENAKSVHLLTLAELESELDFGLGDKYLLTTFHPATLDKDSAEIQINQLFQALDEFQAYKILFTLANSDVDGRRINSLIHAYVEKNASRAIAFPSLGTKRYLSALKHASAVIGNSSSGIIEAPSFDTPTINVGDRQKGRIQGESIFNCPAKKDEISMALSTALSDELRQHAETIRNPYEGARTSESIARLLGTFSIENLPQKTFYDINQHGE